jgi:predicted Ser/Thr protein kinase
LMSDLKNVVSLSLTDKTGTNEKSKRQRNRAVRNLKDRGYCDNCANIILSFIGEILRKES